MDFSVEQESEYSNTVHNCIGPGAPRLVHRLGPPNQSERFSQLSTKRNVIDVGRNITGSPQFNAPSQNIAVFPEADNPIVPLAAPSVADASTG